MELASISMTSRAITDCCGHCQQATELKRCARCRSISYCSRDCQKADWKDHKKVCGGGDNTAGSGSSGHPGSSPRQITSLHMSRVDMSLRDGRWLQYYSDDLGLSELDLSKYIGNDDGKLVWDSSGFCSSTVKAMLVNGHVLTAKLYRSDGSTLTKSWINLDTRIHNDDEVLVYDAERALLGEITWPWTMKDYHVLD